MRRAALLAAGFCLPVVAAVCSAQVQPVGLWNFDDPDSLTRADIGQDLLLFGAHEAVPGTGPDDGAARISTGSHYRCSHGLPPSGGGFRVNAYTLVMDVQTYGRGLWHALLQTHPLNSDSADVFINPPGAVGVGATGFSSPRFLKQKTWYRLAIVVENPVRFEIYADTERILNGVPQAIDSPSGLFAQALFFADRWGCDGEIDVSRIALYDRALDASEVAELGGLGELEYFLTPPFQQNLKTDGISILWETAQPDSGRVEFGADSSYGSVVAPRVVDTGCGTYVHTAELTGLEPGTTYHYRVVSAAHATADAVLRTAPLGEPDFAFGVWGDSQGYNRGAYDRDPTEPTRAIFQHMRGQNLSFAVGVGDLAEIGNSYADARVFHLDRAIAVMGTHRPLFFAWGNHDVGSQAVIRKFADLPSKDRGAPYDAGYGSYSFDYAGCHFICIDYLCEFSDIPGWVEADLQSSAAQDARFIFLFIHRPPYSERQWMGEEHLRRLLVPLMEEYGVDVCFSGHTHEYQRGFWRGVYYCITGQASWLCEFCPLVCDWPQISRGGYIDIGPGIEGGLINGYVRVEVAANAFTVRMLSFYPDGSFVGQLDLFSASPSEAADREAHLPPRLSLAAPSPFRPPAAIHCTLAAGGGAEARLQIIDPATGRVLRTLGRFCPEDRPCAFSWDGNDEAGRRVPSAVYLARLRAGEQRAQRSLLVIR